MQIVKRRKLFYIISALLLIPGLISLMINGLQLGIDFTGGSRLEVRNVNKISEGELRDIIQRHTNVITVQESDLNAYLIRTEPISQDVSDKILNAIQQNDESAQIASFETIGPTIGSETTRNAFIAVVIASLAISGYIAYVFREVSKPIASWKYGVAAIVGLLHDIVFVLGVFSILGVLLNVEIDALFITAILTVMGFSVHDTIVVFDRIRESLKKELKVPFEEIVNQSLLSTLNRSLNTSISTLLVLFTLLLFSQDALRWFVFALFIGIIIGTYSSIFNAAQLLVTWNNWDKGRKKVREVSKKPAKS